MVLLVSIQLPLHPTCTSHDQTSGEGATTLIARVNRKLRVAFAA